MFLAILAPGFNPWNSPHRSTVARRAIVRRLGVFVTSRMRGSFFISAVMLAVMWPGVVASADPLATYVQKETIDRADMATIETHVKQRVRALVEAGKDAADRRRAHDTILETAQNRKATPAGLSAYAEAVASELSNAALNSDRFEVAFEGVIILSEMNHPNVASALAQALHSPHAAVRYRAATGLKALHEQLAKEGGAVGSILRSLRLVGAKERDELVLRAIYEAVDFCSDNASFSRANEVAEALDEILSSRLTQLENGARDEWRDEAGIVAAGAAYPSASPSQQQRLIGLIYRYQNNLLERYRSPDTASEYLRTLRRLAKVSDQVLARMMQASKVTPPSQKLEDALKPKPTDASIKAAEAVLAEVKSRLAGEPWKIP